MTSCGGLNRRVPLICEWHNNSLLKGLTIRSYSICFMYSSHLCPCSNQLGITHLLTYLWIICARLQFNIFNWSAIYTPEFISPKSLHLINYKVMNITSLPYTATSLSILSRCIFMFLLYKNKSTNSLSLAVSALSSCSSSLWLYYSVYNDDEPMIIRSSTELILLLASIAYIVRNKCKTQILP